MKTLNVILTSGCVLVGILITACATTNDQSRVQCGNDYTCLSDNAFKYRQQAEQLNTLAQRYEIEAAAMTGQNTDDMKHHRDLAKTYRLEAQQADDLAQEYRRQLPHNMVH